MTWCYLRYFWIGRNRSSGQWDLSIKASHFFAEEAPVLATPMISDPQEFSYSMDHRCACSLLALECWYCTGLVAVHTRKSTSSAVLSQSDDGLQYVDCCTLGSDSSVSDACEKGPIGECLIRVYCTALTRCRLDTRHRWRSSGVRVIFRSQPGPTIARHEGLQGAARPELCPRGTVCVPGRVRPGFHGVYQTRAHRWADCWVEMCYIILMCDKFGAEQHPRWGCPSELAAYWSHGWGPTPRTGLWQPECCPVYVLVRTTPATCVSYVVVVGWTSDAFAPWAGVHRRNLATRGTLPRTCSVDFSRVAPY